MNETEDSPVCGNSALARRLVPYALELLDAAGAQEVEVHLLECEVCYRSLLTIDQASGLLRDYLDQPGAGLPVPAGVLGKKAPKAGGRNALLTALAAFAGALAGLALGYALWS